MWKEILENIELVGSDSFDSIRLIHSFIHSERIELYTMELTRIAVLVVAHPSLGNEMNRRSVHSTLGQPLAKDLLRFAGTVSAGQVETIKATFVGIVKELHRVAGDEREGHRAKNKVFHGARLGPFDDTERRTEGKGRQRRRREGDDNCQSLSFATAADVPWSRHGWFVLCDGKGKDGDTRLIQMDPGKRCAIIRGRRRTLSFGRDAMSIGAAVQSSRKNK